MNLKHLLKPLKQPANAICASIGPHRFARDASLWILMYHRVLPATDPRYALEEPGMVVTPESFQQQLCQLKQLFTMVPLGEWIARRDAGEPLPPRACAVTFDDGWRDNAEHALPILMKEQVPATVFAVAEMIGTHREFWPNRLQRLLNRFDQSKQQLTWLPALESYSASATLDRESISELVAACKQFTDDFLDERMDKAEQAMKIAQFEPALMSWDELRTMQQSGLVEIGSHTCNHRRLVEGLDPGVMQREIVQSKRLLEDQLNKPVELFCYPNGDASPAAISLVEQHYRAAVTTRHGINARTADATNLARIGIHEDIGNKPVTFQARLSGWM